MVVLFSYTGRLNTQASLLQIPLGHRGHLNPRPPNTSLIRLSDNLCRCLGSCVEGLVAFGVITTIVIIVKISAYDIYI